MPSSSASDPNRWNPSRQLKHLSLVDNEDYGLDANQWSYLAEGGKSLLVRYTGPTTVAGAHVPWISPDGSRALALRIEKRQCKPWGAVDGIKKRRVTVDDPKRLYGRSNSSLNQSDVFVRRLAYEEDVITPLLKGLPHTLTAAVAPSLQPKLYPLLPFHDDLDYHWSAISKRFDFLEQLANRIEADRPASRRAKDEIDIDCPDVIEVVEDLSQASPEQEVLCVEIKPKWLFNTSTTSATYSRYRKHAILKSGATLTPQEVDELYEPLDLASGNSERVEKALRALVKVWRQGGNNLRVFDSSSRLPRGGGGSALDAEATAALESMLQRLVAASHAAQQTASSNTDELLVSALLPIATSKPFRSLIKRLAHLQRHLCPGARGDLSHLDELWRLWTQNDRPLRFASFSTDGNSSSPLSEPSPDAWIDFVEDWQAMEKQARAEATWKRSAPPARQAAAAATSAMMRAVAEGMSPIHSRTGMPIPDDALSELACRGQKLWSKLENCRDEAMRNAVLGALCSASFKDCSIWIRVPVPQPTNTVGAVAGGHSSVAQRPWLDSVTFHLIDVDIKPVSKIKHWLQLDEDIEECFEAWKEKHGIQDGARRVRRRVE